LCITAVRRRLADRLRRPRRRPNRPRSRSERFPHDADQPETGR
jgi:hypothetical protein